jgi:hypothetical protein
MKKIIKEQTKKVDCSACGNPEQCRVCMFQFMIKPSKNNNNKPYFVGDFDSFFSEKFQNNSSLKSLYSLLVSKNIYQFTYADFVKKYACDLVNKSGDESLWGKETIGICKTTLPPEPIKKSTPIEIIQKYSNQGIFPFTKGKLVTNADGINGYYEKEGKHQGREGIFIIQAPNKEGVTNYGFYIDGENVFNGVHKIQNIIHESKRKKKNISERHDRDLRVLHLLKEVSRINETKKKLVLEALSPGQAKAELQKVTAKYFSTEVDFLDQIQMENYTAQIIDLLNKEYKGNIFGWFRRAIELASVTIPGESGEESEIRPKTDRYIQMLAELNGIQTKALFYDPTTTEIENGQYEAILPESVRGLVKTGLKVYRPKITTKDENSFRTKEVSKESCQTELRTIYSEAQGTFRNNKDYCKSQTFQDRKDYLKDCYNKSNFKKTANIVTANQNRFYQMYEQLYRGIMTNRDGGTTRLPNECAFKN